MQDSTIAMSSNSDNLYNPEEPPKPNNPSSLPQGDYEMRDWVLKERQYRRNLQGKVLQKAALDAQHHTLELTSHLWNNACPTSCALGDDTPLQITRPVIWGSNMYRGLWEKAATIVDYREVEIHSSTSPSIPELDESNSFQDESLQCVPMMDPNCILML